MTPDDESTATPPPLISQFQEALTVAAAEIAGASRELEAPIEEVERYLASLKIHVPAWVEVKCWETQHEFWRRELGYDYVDQGWHIAVRETEGNHHDPEDTLARTWPFNKTPRKSRISAIDKLPELMQDIIKEAQKTARRLREKAAEANAFAAPLKATRAKK